MTPDIDTLLRTADVVDLDSVPAGTAAGARRLVANRSRPRRHRGRSLALALAALVLVGTGGTALAYGLLSSADVEAGLPESSAVFQGTDPRCTPTAPDTFDCELATPPTAEYAADWRGAKETFDDRNGTIAGGCVSSTSSGMSWTCYVGERAVQAAVVDASQLGRHQDSPGHG